MLNYCYLFLCACLLTACASQTPTVSGVADFPDAHTALGLYAQARIAWGEGKADRAILLSREAHAADPSTPYPLTLEADILLKTGKVQEALAVLERATKIAPSFREPHLLAGTIMASMGKDREAAAYLRTAVKLDPGKEDAVLHLSTILIRLFEYEETVAVLKNLIKHQPESALGNYYLGKAYAQMKLFKDSAGYYKKALELRPDLTQAEIDLAITYEALGELDLAIATYRDALDGAENRAPLLHRLVQLTIQNRRYEEALTYLRRLDDMGLGNAENNRKIGLLYLELERFDEAIKLFGEMLAREPGAHQLRVYLGTAFEEKEQLDLALEQYEKIPVDSDVYPEAAGRMAFIYKEQDKPEQAVELLQRAIAATPASLELHLSLATLYDAINQSQKGLTHLLGVEGRFADEPRFQFRLGVLYDKVGKKSESIQRMKKVIELNPNDAQALNYLGYTFAEMGIYLEEALGYTNRALAIRPDDGFFMDTLGWVYYQMKKYDEALRYLEKAFELVPDDPTIAEHLGDVHVARKEAKKALKYYKKAKSIDPAKKELDVKIRRLLRGESGTP